jgi:hypothetical protein
MIASATGCITRRATGRPASIMNRQTVSSPAFEPGGAADPVAPFRFRHHASRGHGGRDPGRGGRP